MRNLNISNDTKLALSELSFLRNAYRLLEDIPTANSRALNMDLAKNIETISNLVTNGEILEAINKSRILSELVAKDYVREVQSNIASFSGVKIPFPGFLGNMKNGSDVSCFDQITKEYRFTTYVPFALRLVPDRAISEYLELGEFLTRREMPSPEQSAIIRQAMEADAGEPLEYDSGLTWMCFASSYMRRTRDKTMLTSQNFSRDLSDCYTASKDEQRVLSLATAELGKIRSCFTTCREFGDDVPLLNREEQFSRLDTIEWFHNFAPFLFGHECMIMYDMTKGFYVFTTRDKKLESLGIPFEDLNTWKITGVPTRFADPRAFICFDRFEMQKCLDFLRSKRALNLRSISQDDPLELPVADRFRRYSKNLFLFRDDNAPISIVVSLNLKVESFRSFGDKGLRDRFEWLARIETKEAVPSHLLVGKAGEKIENGKSIIVKLKLDQPLSVKLWKRLTAELSNIKEMRLVGTYGLESFVLFPNPINGFPLSSFNIDKKERRLFKEDTVSIYGLQKWLENGNMTPIIEPPIISLAHSRFKYPSIKLNANSEFKINIPINRPPLTFAYDPTIEELGFSPDNHGRNALTNFWHVSFPLTKPTAEQFNHPFFRPIRALSDIPSKSWNSLLHAIEGDYVRALKIVSRDNDIEDQESQEVRKKREREPNDLKIGKFYKEPREQITLIGKWIVSHCKKGDTPYFIVDSPLYGDALWVFRNLPSAEAAARHFSRKNAPRIDATLFPGFVKRLYHSDNWQANLSKVIEEL